MSGTCRILGLDELIAYERGELDGEAADRVEEHYFACAVCTERLGLVQALGAGIAELVRGGRVSANVTSALVEEARTRGIALRTYHLDPGDVVPCTASPTDDFVVVSLGIDADDVESADVAIEILFPETGHTETQRTEGVAVDRARRELVYAFSGDQIRALPRSRWTMEVALRTPGGDRRLGPYTLDHTPWADLSEPR